MYFAPLLLCSYAFNVVSVHLSFDVCTHVCVFATHLFLCISVFYFVLYRHSFFYFLFSQIVRVFPIYIFTLVDRQNLLI